MIKLNYAELQLNGDIPYYNFETPSEMLGFLLLKQDNGKVVYLCSLTVSEDTDDSLIFVQHGMANIVEFLELYINEFSVSEQVDVHEYASYEEAYKVALMMKESETDLTYEN